MAGVTVTNPTRASTGNPPFSPGVSVVVEASRTSGRSPCTVVFNIYGSSVSGYDAHEVWRLAGCYWDFNDSGSGSYTTTGALTKTNKVGGAAAAHTFVVDDGGGTVDFEVLVNVKMPNGATGQGSVTISVEAQDSYYSGANTIAVSDSLSTGNASLWESGWDRNVPSGATLLSVLPDHDAMDGKRVMIHRGSDFSGSAEEFNMIYGTSNVVITDFGDDADARAIVPKFNLGLRNDVPNSTSASDFDYSGFGGVWLDNITVEKVRTPGCQLGMTYQHVGFHDIDSDYSGANLPVGLDLGWSTSRQGDYCLNASNGLSPANVPFIRGLYLSEVTAIGADDFVTVSDARNSLYHPDAAEFPCCIGSTFDRTSEHNFRTHGWQKSYIGESDFLGNHVAASKHCLTFRGVGYADLGHDWSIKDWSDVGSDLGAAPYYVYLPRNALNLIQDCTLSHGTDAGVAQGGAFLKISPSADSVEHLIEDSVIRDVTLTSTVNDPVSTDILYAGRWLSVGEGITYPNDGAVDQGSAQDLDAIDLGSGTPSLVPNYEDQSAIPVPDAPR